MDGYIPMGCYIIVHLSISTLFPGDNDILTIRKQKWQKKEGARHVASKGGEFMEAIASTSSSPPESRFV